MTTEERTGKKKIQCWINQDMWDKLEAMGFTSQTVAVTKAFENLIGDPSKIPDESFCIPELRAEIAGLKLLVQEKDERITDLKRETETLNTFAHYFKSLEYRRLEQGSEELRAEVQRAYESPASAIRRASEKKVLKKKCLYCGAEFETTNPRKMYCSNNHKEYYYRKGGTEN